MRRPHLPPNAAKKDMFIRRKIQGMKKHILQYQNIVAAKASQYGAI